MSRWVVARCPQWCQQQHEMILTPAGDPTELDQTAPVVIHATELTSTQDGMAVDLVSYEPHPNDGPPGPTGLVVYLPETHACEPISPHTLRSWATALTHAATAYEQLIEGDLQP